MNYALMHKYTNKKTPNRWVATSKPGFTFVELILVFAVIAGLLAIIMPRIQNYRRQSQIGMARLGMRTLHESIDIYKTDTDKYPATLTDLTKKPADAKLWNGPYVSKTGLTDPWGNKFKYAPTPDSEHPYELFSYGPEGRKASKGDQISVWDEK